MARSRSGSGRFPPLWASERVAKDCWVKVRFCSVIPAQAGGPPSNPSWKEETRSKALPCARSSAASVPTGSRKVISALIAASMPFSPVRRSGVPPSRIARRKVPA